MTDPHGGSSDQQGGYTAWGYYVASQGGGGSISVDNTCRLEELPDRPAHYEYNVISYDGGETYRVWYDCVADGVILEDADGRFPENGDTWDNIDYWDVTPAEPRDMINEAIARLDPVPPEITTDPGGDTEGLVGLATHLSFADPLGTETMPPITDGPLTVEIWAEPTGEVTWDTGDDLAACNTEAAVPGGCSHVYEESSLGEDAEHNGLPAYTITAEITYIGGYAVYANGAYVGGDDNIGDVVRTAETTLAVNEAQAVNTRSG